MPDPIDPNFAVITPRETIGTADLAPSAGPPAPKGSKVGDWFNGLPPTLRHLLSTAGMLALTIAATWIALQLKVPVPVVPPVPDAAQAVNPAVVEKAAQLAGDAPPPVPAYGFGWSNDPEARAASFARLPVTVFATTPAGRVARGDVPDTFLWRAVRKAAGKAETEDWYPNVNQRSVGCCVGCGWKHASDVCQAVQVTHAGGTWKPLSVEVIYGLSRVDVGGGQLGGEDGSVGAWAREAVRDYGEAAMEKYASDDLSTFDPIKARRYGSKGVPKDIKEAAKAHPVKATAQVSSWADVQKAVGQGYPVAVCSDVGFENPDGAPGTRDRDGFCRARGSWPHCMCFIAVRGGTRPGAFCLNSWGDDAHRGPVWPADAPKAGFWVDSGTVDKMVREGDSFSLSDMTTFEARRLDWFAAAPQLNPFDRLALTRPNRRQWAVSDPEYALAP